MSGPKKADVQLKLSRAVDAVRREQGQLHEVQQNITVEIKKAVEKSKKRVEESIRKARETKTSEEVKKYAPEELKKYEEMIKRAGELEKKASTIMEAEHELERKGKELTGKAESEFKRASDVCEKVRKSLEVKSSYLHEEDRLANEAHSIMQSASNLSSEGLIKINHAVKKFEEAKNLYDQASNILSQAEEGRNNVLRIVESRKKAEDEAKRIAEERRNAQFIISEINCLLESIRTSRHDKFAPGEFDQIVNSVNKCNRDFQNKDYKFIEENGKNIINRLKNLHDKIIKNEEQWNTERQMAVNARERLQSVVQGMNLDFVIQWTKKDGEVDEIKRKLEETTYLINSDRFKKCEEECRKLEEAITELNEEAIHIENKHQSRRDIGFTIMDVLEELGFDEPENFYEVENDKTSNWVIYAESPSEKGNIEMKIGMDGHVDLNVTEEPYEGACVESLRGIESRLVDADIELNVTDWGKAKEYAEGKKQKEKVVVKETVKVREKEKTRSKNK